MNDQCWHIDTDTLTIVNTAAAADDVFETENLATTGYETVTFNGGSLVASQDFGTITLNATANQTPTLTLNFTGANAVTTGVITANVVDASGLTGTATFTTVGATVGVTSLTGSANADALVGSATATTINGGAGDDTITGGAAADTISGGAGDDNINGAAGDDTSMVMLVMTRLLVVLVTRLSMVVTETTSLLLAPVTT